MTWLYSGYILEDDSTAKLAELKLHIVEVVNGLANFKSKSTADGWAYTRQELQDYLKTLKAEMKELQAELGLGVKKSGMFANMRIS